MRQALLNLITVIERYSPTGTNPDIDAAVMRGRHAIATHKKVMEQLGLRPTWSERERRYPHADEVKA